MVWFGMIPFKEIRYWIIDSRFYQHKGKKMKRNIMPVTWNSMIMTFFRTRAMITKFKKKEEVDETKKMKYLNKLVGSIIRGGWINLQIFYLCALGMNSATALNERSTWLYSYWTLEEQKFVAFHLVPNKYSKF